MNPALATFFPMGLADLRRTRPRQARLERDFAFVSPTVGRRDYPAGTETDYASIPRVFWALYPPDGDYTDAAVAHDEEYWRQTLTREQADRLFLEAMTALGIPWARRRILYAGVRMGGWASWRANRKRRLAGLPRF